MQDEIEKVQRDSIEIQEGMQKTDKDSSLKNSVTSNTKNFSEKIEVSDRTHKKQDVASKNVALNTIVTNDEIKIALIAKNVLYVTCAKNVLIPCHDNFLAKYKLNVHSKVRRALFTNPRTVKSRSKDSTPAVSKTRSCFSIKNLLRVNLEGDDLLTGDCESNLYTISLPDMAASSPVCLMSKAFSTKSWLWHRKLSHLNFSTINNLTKHALVDGLPKFKYGKDHLYSASESLNTLSKEDLDNLFGPMFDEYFEKKSSDMPINSAAQQVQNREDSPVITSIDIEEHEAPPIVTTSE
nr:integrase, catalytic region, zinc finger, CCHC-type, peptidase aspartic, catalytic [Tanacetum cinerariifolium]